jgi:hypothetical protein
MVVHATPQLHADARRGLLLLKRLAGDPGAQAELTPAPVRSSGFGWLVAKRIDALLDDNPLQGLYDRIWARQRAALLEAVTALQGSGIPVLSIKGAEVHARYRGERALGAMKDIDLLVRKRDVEAARGHMHALGYRHGSFDPRVGTVVWLTPRCVADEERGHYELAPLVRVDAFDLSVEEAEVLRDQPIRMPVWQRTADSTWWMGTYVDLHHGVATNISAERFFDRAEAGTCGAGLSMCASDLLWVTASRYYSEVGSAGKRSLREVAYVIETLTNVIDWDQVGRAAVDLDLGPSLFYPLAFLRHIIHADIPDDVLEVCSPLKTSRRRDWGWQLGSVFDFLEPCPLAGGAA